MLATLFLVSGLITRRTGTVALDRMGGLLRGAPGLAVLFAVPAMTLAGCRRRPGSSRSSRCCRRVPGAGCGPAVAGVVVVASLLTLYALVRVWVRVFWGEPQPPRPRHRPGRRGARRHRPHSVPMYAATAGLVAVSLAIAAFAGPLAGMTERAGVDLLDREPYRVAVLGSER